MKSDPIKQLEKKFATAQDKFEGAKKEYLKAVQEIKAFSDPSLVESAVLIKRAAYSDRMAWIMSIMAKLAYIEFETSEEELARLKLNLKAGIFNW